MFSISLRNIYKNIPLEGYTQSVLPAPARRLPSFAGAYRPATAQFLLSDELPPGRPGPAGGQVSEVGKRGPGNNEEGINPFPLFEETDLFPLFASWQVAGPGSIRLLRSF